MTINSRFSHEKWWFSIAMLNYQRVFHENRQLRLSIPALYAWTPHGPNSPGCSNPWIFGEVSHDQTLQRNISHVFFEIMASINMYYKKIYKRYEHHYDIRCKIINIMANIYQYLITIKICKKTSRYTSAPGPYGRLAAERRAFGGRLAPQQAQPAAARAGAGAPAPGALEAPRPRGGAEETRLLRVTRATEKTRRAGGAGSIAKLPWW